MARWTVLIVMCAAQFVMVLDTTVMNVSVSNVVEDLDTSITQVQLAITLYTLVMGSFMLLGGKLGDLFGRKKIFGIGLVVYGIGSLTTALSPNVNWLLFGWSFVEGAGAVMVMPAIISLTAANYEGRDRATAYGALGGVAAAGAAAGPLIGGWVTEALTWRVVFAAETVVCVFIVLMMRKIADSALEGRRPKLDFVGAVLSAVGLGLIVLGLLKAGEWGIITPRGGPEIGGETVQPFGLSLVPFMIVLGGFFLSALFKWERRLVERDGTPLMHPEILRPRQPRNGLVMLLAQQTVIGGIFFVIPIYLQYVLGKSAFETGVKLLPMSAAMLICAFTGPKLAQTKSPRTIVVGGLVLVVSGSLLIVSTISPSLSSTPFAIGMAIFGAGFGFVASQLGNVIMSSVGDADRGEAGGLQGTAQNIGTSIGVAAIGAILIAALGSGLNQRVLADPALSSETKAAVTQGTAKGVEILSAQQLDAIAEKSGLPAAEANAVVDHYEDAQIVAIKQAVLLAALFGLIGIGIANRLPRMPGVEMSPAALQGA